MHSDTFAKKPIFNIGLVVNSSNALAGVAGGRVSGGLYGTRHGSHPPTTRFLGRLMGSCISHNSTELFPSASERPKSSAVGMSIPMGCPHPIFRQFGRIGHFETLDGHNGRTGGCHEKRRVPLSSACRNLPVSC